MKNALSFISQTNISQYVLFLKPIFILFILTLHVFQLNLINDICLVITILLEFSLSCIFICLHTLKYRCIKLFIFYDSIHLRLIDPVVIIFLLINQNEFLHLFLALVVDFFKFILMTLLFNGSLDIGSSPFVFIGKVSVV